MNDVSGDEGDEAESMCEHLVRDWRGVLEEEDLVDG
jgi:hypothetical protein